MAPDAGAPRVLIVEDEAALADTVRYHLEREGFAVEVAPDGRAGIERFRAWSPSLVILDLMLPGLLGTEVCKALRTSSSGDAVRSVRSAFSARTTRSTRRIRTVRNRRNSLRFTSTQSASSSHSS